MKHRRRLKASAQTPFLHRTGPLPQEGDATTTDLHEKQITKVACVPVQTDARQALTATASFDSNREAVAVGHPTQRVRDSAPWDHPSFVTLLRGKASLESNAF